MASVRDSSPDRLIAKVAEELKASQVQPPEWARFVKTGVGRERPPTQKDWWQVRAASMLRKLYLSPCMGVSSMRKEYSSRKNLGHQPEHRRKASGAITRKILQQLDAAGLTKVEKARGRVITAKGMSLIDKASKGL